MEEHGRVPGNKEKYVRFRAVVSPFYRCLFYRGGGVRDLYSISAPCHDPE
jgi:hypothetical protein